MNEKLRSMASELEQTKKLCEKEMLQNERLTDMKCRVESDIANCKHLLEVENKKKTILEAQMDSNQMLIDQIEKDIQRLSAVSSLFVFSLFSFTSRLRLLLFCLILNLKEKLT